MKRLFVIGILASLCCSATSFAVEPTGVLIAVGPSSHPPWSYEIP